jgi:hypothetical protein
VFLGLGEAATDVLRDEKIELLAAAQIASLTSRAAEDGDRKRWARIVIDSEIGSLRTMVALNKVIQSRHH